MGLETDIEIPVLTTRVTELSPEDDCQPLIVLRNAAQGQSLPEWLWPGYQLAFDQLLENYRVNGLRVDIGEL